MRPDAHRFIRPDWRRYVRPGFEHEFPFERYERKYSPSQPRVPAGSSEGGQWTSESGNAVDGPVAVGGINFPRIISDATPDNFYEPGTQLAQNDRTSGYPVDVREEDQLGGHTIAEHVGKSEYYVLGRVRREALEAERNGFAEGLRVGSFPSLESANKLVNSTLADNKALVDQVANGMLPRKTVNKEFSSVTGFEAYAHNERSQPYIRNTTGVSVVIVRDGSVAKGYRVDTAFPINFDR
jgi:hypothetical protein